MLFSVVGLQQFGKHILHGYDFMVGRVVFLDALDARELIVGFDAFGFQANGSDDLPGVVGLPRAAKHLYYFIKVASCNNINRFHIIT